MCGWVSHPLHRILRASLFFVSCRGGSGLGLYIAAGIVKLHEGCSLSAVSPGEGLGSTFYLQFPVAAAPHQPDEAADIPLQDIPFSSPTSVQPGDRVAENVEQVENLNILVAVRSMSLLDSLLQGAEAALLKLFFYLASSYLVSS